MPTPVSKQIWLFGTISFFMLFSPQTARAQKVLEFDHVIRVMETLEKRIERIQWEVRTRRGKLKDLADLNSVVPTENYDEGWVVWEPHTGRYRVELKSVMHWMDGTAPFIAQYISFAFDGEVTRNFDRAKPGTEFPEKDDHPGQGVLSEGDASHKVLTFGESSGIRYFTPFFGRQILSQMLKEKKSKGELVEITDTTEGDWDIKTTMPPDIFVTIRYSPQKGGAVTSAKYENGSPLGVFLRFIFDLQEVDGFWVPRQLSIVNTINNHIRQTDYRNVRINQPVKDDVFRFEFPMDAVVTDHIQKIVYRAGAPIEDEKKAIQDYIVAQHLSPGSGFTWKKVLIVLIGVAVLAGAFFLWKRRAGWLGTAGLLLVPFLVSPCLGQGPQSPGKTRDSAQQMAQCGYRVSVFALEYFGVKDYEVKEVFAALAPSKEGIRLSAIQQTLESHGLKVQAREGLGEDELRGALGRGRLVIVPFLYGEATGHYFIAMEHAEKGAVLVDVLGEVKALGDGLNDKRGKWFKGLVLFVEKGEKAAKAKPIEQSSEAKVEFEPAEMDFGKIVISPNEITKFLKKEFTIHNAGKKAVEVKSVSMSCGCLRGVSWKGGSLNAGERKNITFEIIPSAWGIGRETRGVFFDLEGGKGAEFQIKGELVLPEAQKKLAVSPEIIRLNVSKHEGENVIVRESLLTYDSEKQGPPSASSKSTWVEASVKTGENNTARLSIRVTRGKIPFGTSQEAEAQVFVVGEDGAKATVKVVAFRPKFFTASPDFLSISVKEMKIEKIAITPRKEITGGLKAVNTWAEREDLAIVTEENENGSIALTIRPRENSSLSFNTVSCLLRSRQGEKMVVAIIVHVKP